MRRALGIWGILFWPAALSAQEAPPQEAQKEVQIGDHKFRFEYQYGKLERDDLVTVFSGVEVNAPEKGMLLKADRIVAWLPVDDAGRNKMPLRQFYAEGNVVYRGRNQRTGRWDTLRMDSFYFDVVNRRGFFLEFQTLINFPKTKSNIVLRAHEVRLLSQGHAEAEDVTLTTCTYAVPHYFLKFKRASMTSDRPHPPKTPWDIWPYEKDDWSFKGDGVSAEIWGLPVFFWPGIAVTAAAVSTMPLRRLALDQNSRFGFSVYSDWGLDISKGFVDSLNPWGDTDPRDDKQRWGSIQWEIDYRAKRGWAFGLDPEWEVENVHKGYIDTYYLADRGPSPGNEFDQKFLPLVTPDRARVRLFHRQELNDEWRAEVESSYLSDRNLLEEFFEREFKEGKEQETVGYVRYLRGNLGGYFLERNRINDFQTQVEFLPKVSAFLFDQPVVRGLTYTQEFEVVRLRQRFDENLTGVAPDTVRVDTLNTLVYTLNLGPVILSPFGDARVTWYEHDLVEESETRLLAIGGVRATSEWTRAYNFHWDLVGINKLRHIMLYEARYAHTFRTNILPSALFQYDANDSRGEFDEVVMKIRHRFQTKVQEGNVWRTQEFLEAGAQIEYYPNPNRDTIGFNANNFTSPFHWIALAPHDSTKILEEREWSNLYWDVALRPSKFFAIALAGEYNPIHRQEEAREYVLDIKPSERFTLHIAQTFLFDITNAMTMRAIWQMTEKWKLTADAQFDFKTGNFISRKATLVRDFHDFFMEIGFEEDVGRDERKVYFSFTPSFLRVKGSAKP